MSLPAPDPGLKVVSMDPAGSGGLRAALGKRLSKTANPTNPTATRASILGLRLKRCSLSAYVESGAVTSNCSTGNTTAVAGSTASVIAIAPDNSGTATIGSGTVTGATIAAGATCAVADLAAAFADNPGCSNQVRASSSLRVSSRATSPAL